MSLPPNLIRNLIIVVTASAAFYGFWVIYAGPADVWDSIVQVGWSGWAIILGLSLFNYALRFIRWQGYLSSLGYKIPAWRHFKFYLAGFAFTATPGKVGEAVRSLYLNKYGVRYTDSLAAFFVERLVDVVAMVLLALLAAYAFEQYRWLVICVSVFLILLLPLIRSSRFHELLESLCSKSDSERVRKMSQHLLGLLDSSGKLLRAKNLYGGLFLGVIAWAAEGLALYVVVLWLGVDIPVALAVGIYGIAILAGALSFVPGGLGGTEVIMGALLILSGVAEPVAVSAVLICRIATLWFAVAIGLLCALEIEIGDDGVMKNQKAANTAGRSGG